MARKEVKRARRLFSERQKEIEERRKEILKAKFEEKQRKERNKIERLEGFTKDIVSWGLWQNEQQVDQHLSLYSKKKDKLDALKAQLGFRKQVLHQKPKDESMKDVYSVSKSVDGRRVQLSVEELALNVKKFQDFYLGLMLNLRTTGPYIRMN
ncbi:hypothetical protein KUTeg_008658 [Tegillarca granosa]|uniref:Uncharacterized protein n=1 Tax=Tegillarca granosa TaxID=220873 RepID=A0ABQ9FE14_TEGGR|nr:hypothetical protein KUTeg_008658 [Tegillarca granosa]